MPSIVHGRARMEYFTPLYSFSRFRAFMPDELVSLTPPWEIYHIDPPHSGAISAGFTYAIRTDALILRWGGNRSVDLCGLRVCSVIGPIISYLIYGVQLAKVYRRKRSTNTPRRINTIFSHHISILPWMTSRAGTAGQPHPCLELYILLWCRPLHRSLELIYYSSSTAQTPKD